MAFLKKLGVVLGRATQILTGVAPFFPQYNKETAIAMNSLNQIAGIVVTVEAVGQALNLPGADKLKGATPLIAQLILQSDLMVGKKIDNHALFMQGCMKLGDGMADILNSMDDKVDTEDKV